MASETYELDGNLYHYIKGRWTDSKFTTVTPEERSKLDQIRAGNVDFESKTLMEIITIAQDMKDDGDFHYSFKVFDEILKRCDEAPVIRSVLPRQTSVLRNINKPWEAINLYDRYNNKYGKEIISAALMTSIAAAYCDVDNLEEARKKANKAKAILGGGSSQELINVYLRIKSLEESRKYV